MSIDPVRFHSFKATSPLWALGLALLLGVLALAFIRQTHAQQGANEAEDATQLCPVVKNNLDVNLCMEGVMDGQKNEINELLNEIQSANPKLNLSPSRTQFQAFQTAFCDNYRTIYKGTGSQMGTSIAYCKYDLNVVYIDQLRIMLSQAQGRGKYK